MKRRTVLSRDIAISLLLLLVFLFAPLRIIRLPALFFFLIHGISFISARLLPLSIRVSRAEEILRVNRLQRFEVAIEVRNLAPFPMRSLFVIDSPGGVYSDEPPVRPVSLGPRERCTVSWTAHAQERGEFTVGPVDVTGRSFLGFHDFRKCTQATLKIIVYPAVFPLTLEHKRGLPAGNIGVLNRLYEDVSRFRSLREYIPGDELRRINWKVSARLGKLHTTEYVPSLYFPVLILLNLTASDYPIGNRYQLTEYAIEVAGSLVVYFAGLKQEVGLASTAHIAGEEGHLAVPIRAGFGHGMRILEALARAQRSDVDMDFTRLVSGSASVGSGLGIRTGTRIIAVTPGLSPERRSELIALSRKGWNLEVFFVTSPSARLEDSVMAGIASRTVDASERADIHG
jgi:uncharacterized protein (DUF58 family)